MHAFGSPFTGIFVGGISILLITLIALYSKHIWTTLFKALCIVLLVKLSVSPHSPVTAYLAVSFQAVFGAIVFSVFSVRTVPIMLLGAVTFLESAMQKLLVLTILYGESLWNAIDVYGAWVSDKLTFLPGTLSASTLMALFISLYLVAGIFTGLLIIRTITLINGINGSDVERIPESIYVGESLKGKSFLPKKVLLFWGIAIFVITIPMLFFETKLGGIEKGVYILARSLLILFLWYVIVGPLLLKGLNSLLSKSRNQYKADVQNTLELFPYLRGIIQHAWHDTQLLKGRSRVHHFLAKSIVYSIHFKVPKE